MSDTPTAAETHALFERVLDADNAERTRLLDELCADRPQLRARVEALLAADAAAHDVLDGDATQLWRLLIDDAEPAPTQIGAYRIVREVGRGGMGVVYLAERADPEFRQQVALKIIGPRADARYLAERFRRERQILAKLTHPNIAQLFDGGLTPEGLPFLAMEYVDGERIDRWCDARRLDVDERLRLFLTVCDAVNHAQQNLVVHRDLKPANILVTPDGHVKLLDFGIARLLPEEGDVPDPEQTALHAFTLRYASPEQIRRTGSGTATDVYALGVILFELLTGTSPFPEMADSFEAARVVLESDPPLPSRAAIAAGGIPDTSPDRLRRHLRGDLDAIILKAMRRDPAERYTTASGLRDDIARYLRHEPVIARPDSTRYRVRKFVRRHRGAVAAAVALVLLTASFATIHGIRITRERDRAELNAQKAQETRDFLLGLFNANLPRQSLGEELTALDMLERGVARTDSLAGQPALRALLLTTLGDVYRVLGRFDEATSLIDSSVVAYRALGSDQLGLADALTSQGLVRYDLREYEAALLPTTEALDIYRRALGEDDPLVLRTLGNVATLTSHTGDLEASLRAHEQLLQRRRRILGPDDETVAVTLNNIGTTHYRLGQFADAERYHREALELRRRIIPREHPDYALSLSNLAAALREQGDLEAAEAMYREVMELRREVLGEDHPRMALSYYNLGRMLQARGEYDDAEAYLRLTLDIDRRSYGDDHPEVGFDAHQLARLLVERGRCEDALPVFDEAIRVFTAAERTESLETAREERSACSGASSKTRTAPDA